MVFSFTLPTTSHLSFQAYLSSSTHPSLPQSASTARHALRLELKAHKHLTRPERENHLQTVLNALNDYLPYLLAISHGLSGKTVNGEEVDITLREEIQVEWRLTLTSSSSVLRDVLDSGRIRGHGLDFELAFTMTTLGYVLNGLARTRVLQTMYASSTPSTEERTAAVQTATRHLLQASAVHLFIASSPSFSNLSLVGRTVVPDLEPGTQSALSTLAHAEATLLAVLKDDAYTFTCIQSRNPQDKEWMIRAPQIPKVRALLFARLCVRSAEYAEQAVAGLGVIGAAGKSRASGKVDEDLIEYVQNLSKAARAKACRFFAVDAELAGKVGKAIAWLRTGKGTLGFKSLLADEEGNGKSKGGLATRLKRDWAERREERKLEKGTTGGNQAELDCNDAGLEEYRVLDMLETKWVKMNDTMNTQAIPPSAPLVSELPSGRDIHTPPSPYIPPSLHEDQLIRMRAMPSADDPSENEVHNCDEVEEPGKAYPRASPGSRNAANDSAYY